MAIQPENSRPCLLFIQIKGPETRTFRNYPNVSRAFDGKFCLPVNPLSLNYYLNVHAFHAALLALYEDSLSPETRQSIDLDDYYKFIDDMPDLFLMLFDPAIAAFEPHSKEWIKSKTYQLFRDSDRDWSTPVTNEKAKMSNGSAMEEDMPLSNSDFTHNNPF